MKTVIDKIGNGYVRRKQSETKSNSIYKVKTVGDKIKHGYVI